MLIDVLQIFERFVLVSELGVVYRPIEGIPTDGVNSFDPFTPDTTPARSFKRFLEDLNRFTNAQAMILEDRGKRFGQTLDELARFTGTVADRRLDVGRAIDSLAGASRTLATNQATLDQFLDSLEDANALLADQGDELGDLFRGLSRFGTVNARFLARHEDSINRGFKALEPVLEGLAGTEDELRSDIEKLRLFLELFPRSMGGGPGDRGRGDYIQADAVVCEVLGDCNTRGEKGDVPREGSR